jgi:putative DNA primase/helicase
LGCLQDHVRRQLGLPRWQPGDGRNRRVEPARLKAFDRTAVNAESERRGRSEDDLGRIARAVAIWDEAADPCGTVAETYLRSRALVLTGDVAGTVLRFHPACPWRDEDTGATIYIPALIAAFRSVDDDAITAVHRIRLDQPERWPKTQRRMLGVVHRSAVKLGPVGATLHIGEGIETCMAGCQLGHTPAWALGSASPIARFPVLENVTRLRLLGEHDNANARAVELCAQRWHSAGRRVQVVMPDIGSDLNDELMAAAP